MYIHITIFVTIHNCHSFISLVPEVLELLSRVNDSKQLAEQQREELYQVRSDHLGTDAGVEQIVEFDAGKYSWNRMK